MKHNILLIAIVLAAISWLLPQHAAATLDVATNLTQPFTIETTPATNSYIRFRRDLGSSGSTKVTINLQYRKQENGGVWGDWTTIATASTTTVAQLYGNSIALTAGTTYKIQFRGINSSGFSTASVSGSGSANNYNITLESSSYTWSATMYGNIMSLIVGYDTDNETAAQEALAAANEIKSDYCFAGLFYDNNSGSTYPPAINAENLIFPATYLRAGCYRNLFYQYNRSDASFKGGLNEGPCFLATDWNNLSGAHVNNTFLNVFNQCANLKSAHFSFTSCPTSDDFNSYSVYGTPGDGSLSANSKTLYAPAGFNPTSCTIGTWSGGHTIWSYDPSAEPGGGDEPGGGSSSDPASVNVYQAGTTDTTKILYDLPANAVDMGTGLAWATSNYDGAQASKFAPDYTVKGPWYTPSEVVMPTGWRFPTETECAALFGNTYSRNSSTYIVTIESRISNQSIGLKGSGYREGWSPGTNRYATSGNYGSSYPDYPYYYATANDGNDHMLYYETSTNTLATAGITGYYTHHYTIRPVYAPSYTTHTLTVIVGSRRYQYMCEEGQEVTVTAVPNTAEAQEFKWWSDDHGNTTAERTFTVNSDIEVEAVFTLDPNIPQGTATFVDWNGTQLYEVAVPVGYTPVYNGQTPTRIGYNFSGWSPAIAVMGGSDVTYTATYTFDSPDANVNVYQNVTNSTTKILYNISAKTGLDGLTYTPIDMGYGVAWADKNIGAATENAVGSYFYWGGTEAKTSFAQNQKLNASSYAANYRLSVEQDAAYQNMGTNWRVPTKEDFQNLIDNTAISNNNTFTSPTNSKSIVFPASGLYAFNIALSQYQHYWTNTLATNEGDGDATIYVFIRSGNNAYKVQNKIAYYSNEYAYNSYGMPIRAIYQPEYNTHTLTITISGQQYRYICQEGQNVTVTAVPSTAYVFKWWSDNHGNTAATRTFAMTSDISVEAEFQIDPNIPSHTATFLDWDGTELYQVEIPEGLSPVYSGSEPEREGYVFSGWTPAIAPLGTEDVVYTATYKKIELFTITNTHTTAATSVSMQQRGNSSYAPKCTLYVRVTDKFGAITMDWTQKIVKSTSALSFGSVPAGGKMEIYGTNNGFCSTSSTNNSVYFTITGGTPELSGNLLSLVACSDGQNINNDFVMPKYCFYYLFGANTAIVNAENLELPSTTLSEGCYWYMFYNCTGLVKAPKLLPATVMPPRCYYQMFQGCTALTRSPDIYGQTLTGTQNSVQTGAEASMFSGCTNLSHIRTYLATQWTNQTYHTSYWVNNVQKVAGSFYCPRTLNREIGGSYCIPSNWTIYSYDVTFVPVGGNWSDDTNENKQFTWRTDVSDVTGFMTEQTERVVDYYSDDQCTNKIADINTILTTRPSNDNTTYIYAKMAPTTNYYDITISTDPASGYGTVNTSSMNDVEEGTVISTNSNTLTIGETTITATPTASNEQYTYSFAGWTDNSGNALPDSVTADLDIRANFTQSKKQYNLTWNFNGGTTTEDYTNGLVEWGTPITAPTPTKDGCTFAGWDITPAATMPAATTTYNAQWTDCTISSLTLEDNRDATYYNTFANDYNGVDVETVTYNRTFAANTWSTVCLPFYVDPDNLSGAGWTGKVFEFKHATGTADISEGLYLNFYPAREMEAGKGYLVYSQGAALEGGFEFYDVTIDTDADTDTESAITDLVGYNDGQGTITLVGTLRQGTLTPNTTSQMALKDNKVWYPGSGTTTIRAYRGFFKDSSGSPIPPRVHIVVEGEVVTDLEIMDNGELIMDNAEVRKYIDNGVLIIERNGIRYDAQGKRIEN